MGGSGGGAGSSLAGPTNELRCYLPTAAASSPRPIAATMGVRQELAYGEKITKNVGGMLIIAEGRRLGGGNRDRMD